MASMKDQYQGKIDFIDVDYNSSEAQVFIKEYNITKHPTTLFLDRDGKVKNQIVGYGSSTKAEIENDIQGLLKN